MRVALVNTWYAATEPGAQISADPLRRELAHGLAARGYEVEVIQELPQAATVRDGPVKWTFVPPAMATKLVRRALTLSGRDDAMVKVPSPHLAAAVNATGADIVHSFDLAAYPLLAELGRDSRRRGAALVAHFHGGAPARVGALRQLERAAFANVDRFFFTTRFHAAPWLMSNALVDESRIVEVFETSSTFRPGHRAAARRSTGLRGEPALLHLGRLDTVKDPLTTVAGFRAALPRRPKAHLTFAWTEAPLLDAVKKAAEGLPVTFLGRVANERVEELLVGADGFVQASVREVCGRAVLEAFACGTPCVLSDIPSFRRITDGGRVGALFPVGRDDALADALVALDFAATRAPTRARFDAALSFDRLADDVAGVYQSLFPAGRDGLRRQARG